MTPEETKHIVDGMLEVRGNIYTLMADAKQNKANGKFFAYKKCYNMMSGLIYPLQQTMVKQP